MGSDSFDFVIGTDLDAGAPAVERPIRVSVTAVKDLAFIHGDIDPPFEIGGVRMSQVLIYRRGSTKLIWTSEDGWIGNRAEQVYVGIKRPDGGYERSYSTLAGRGPDVPTWDEVRKALKDET